MEKLKDAQAIIFDWDDTKVATYKRSFQVLIDFAAHKGYTPIDHQQIKRVWGRWLPDLLHGLYHDDDESVDKLALYADYQNFSPQWNKFRFFRGVSRTMAFLRNQGYVLGIVSSGNKAVIERVINKSRLLSVEDYAFIHGARECPAHKPDPEVFNPALEVLRERGISESETIYVGDSENDNKAALARGMGFVAVLTGYTTKQEFLEAGVDSRLIVPTVNYLPRVLKRARG